MIASVVVDVRATLVFFGFLSGPLHGPLHTYLGALALAVVLAGSVLLLSRQFPTAAQLISYQSISVTAVTLASVLGAWLHVTLDAILYPEMNPLYPLTGNPLYGLTSSVTIYGLCTLALLIGAAAGFPALKRQWKVINQ